MSGIFFLKIAQKDLDQFEGCIQAIEENSSEAQVFVLFHKMDLIPADEREQAFSERRALIEERCGTTLQNTMFFPTSIWDESLYKVFYHFITMFSPQPAMLVLATRF
jgi:Ras-related GTP-binding protein A/B